MILNVAWQVKIHKRALKACVSFPQKETRRLFAVIKSLASDPFAGDVKKMEHEEQVWRRRVGSYRVMYELIPADRIVYVFRVERRTTTTYGKKSNR